MNDNQWTQLEQLVAIYMPQNGYFADTMEPVRALATRKCRASVDEVLEELNKALDIPLSCMEDILSLHNWHRDQIGLEFSNRRTLMLDKVYQPLFTLLGIRRRMPTSAID
ncbi:hypothetical protein ACHAQH_008347 [Verticillium albo-atrum]